MDKYNPLIPLIGFVLCTIVVIVIIDAIGPGTSQVVNPGGPQYEIQSHIVPINN